MKLQTKVDLIKAVVIIFQIVLITLGALCFFGCASYPPPERTYFYHESSKDAAWKVAADWVKADPVHRTWTTAGFTGSMRPKITGGEFLLMLRYEAGVPILAGQLVAYERQPSLIAHRVLLTGGHTGALFIKGDNNFQDDGWISKDRVRFIIICVVSFPGQEGNR